MVAKVPDALLPLKISAGLFEESLRLRVRLLLSDLETLSGPSITETLLCLMQPFALFFER